MVQISMCQLGDREEEEKETSERKMLYFFTPLTCVVRKWVSGQCPTSFNEKLIMINPRSLPSPAPTSLLELAHSHGSSLTHEHGKAKRMNGHLWWKMQLFHCNINI